MRAPLVAGVTGIVLLAFGQAAVAEPGPGFGVPPAIPAPADPAVNPGQVTTAALPAHVLNLQNWYLGLPTGEEGNPDSVRQPALRTFSNEYFSLNSARNGVVFRAHSGGVTTSGSKYPRSELREMNGAAKASWNGKKGTHTLELRQAITATPRAKPDVVAGQIHDEDDDLMQILLSGTRLRVRYKDNKYVDLDRNYRLGTVFTIRIVSSGGRVKVWYNGEKKADLALSSSTSYFKAGAYTNSNTSKGDDADSYGEVVVYDLRVRHQ